MREDFQIFRDGALDVMNRYRSNSLFWETRGLNKEEFTPFFTLKDKDIIRDGVLYVSLKAIYLSYEHIPGYEYEFAKDVFGSWDHWIYLITKSSLKHEFAQWREELEIKIRSEAVKNMIYTSKGNQNSSLQAAKWLADKGWEVKAGRPTKADKEKQLRQDSQVRDNVAADMERLGLSIVGK